MPRQGKAQVLTSAARRGAGGTAGRFGTGAMLMLRAAVTVALWAAAHDHADDVVMAKALPGDTDKQKALRIKKVTAAREARTAAVKRRALVWAPLAGLALLLTTVLATALTIGTLCLVGVISVISLGAIARHLGGDGAQVVADVVTLVTPATVITEPTDADRVLPAIRSAQVTGMDAALRRHGDDSLRFVTTPARTPSGERPGTVAMVCTPPGVKAADVVTEAERVATGFPDLPSGCVHLTREEHWSENHFQVFIADHPLTPDDVAPWALLNGPECSAFDPVHLGTDEHGHPVHIELLENHTLVGARSMMGKTVLAMALAEAVGLSTDGDLWAMSAKPGPELRTMQWAQRHWVGPANEATEVARVWGQAAVIEIRRRFGLIAQDAQAGGDSYRLTADLAARAGIGMLLMLIDEAGDIEWDDELVRDYSEILRHGGGAGVHLLMTTQDGTDQGIPRALRKQFKTRIALKLDNATEANGILGDSAAGRGLAPNRFSNGDKGRAAVILSNGWEGTVQLCNLPKLDAERLAAVITARREAAGRLPRPEPGNVDGAPDLVAATLAATIGWPDRVYLADVVAELTAHPRFASLKLADLKAALVDIGCPINEQLRSTVAGKPNGRTGVGFVRPDLEHAYRGRHGVVARTA